MLTVGVRWRFGPSEEREIENIIIRITTVYGDEPPTRGVYRCPDPVTQTTGQPAMCSHNGTQLQPRYRVSRKKLFVQNSNNDNVEKNLIVHSFTIYSTPSHGYRKSCLTHIHQLCVDHLGNFVQYFELCTFKQSRTIRHHSLK